MNIFMEHIGIVVSIVGGILCREIWIQVQIGKIQRDIMWIKKWMNNNGTKGGED